LEIAKVPLKRWISKGICKFIKFCQHDDFQIKRPINVLYQWKEIFLLSMHVAYAEFVNYFASKINIMERFD
jgi:hypothetical protein